MYLLLYAPFTYMDGIQCWNCLITSVFAGYFLQEAENESTDSRLAVRRFDDKI